MHLRIKIIKPMLVEVAGDHLLSADVEALLLLIFSIKSNCEASFGSGRGSARSVICRLAKAPFLPKDG